MVATLHFHLDTQQKSQTSTSKDEFLTLLLNLSSYSLSLLKLSPKFGDAFSSQFLSYTPFNLLANHFGMVFKHIQNLSISCHLLYTLVPATGSFSAFCNISLMGLLSFTPAPFSIHSTQQPEWSCHQLHHVTSQPQNLKELLISLRIIDFLKNLT